MWTVYNFAIIQQSLHLESPHEEGKTFVTVVTCWQGQSRYLRTRNTLTSNHIKAETLILSNILRFYRHAIKTAQKNTGNRPVEEAKKVKCYKRLIYKKFFQISGLCGPQFLNYLQKHITHICRALYGDAILVDSFSPPMSPPEINENICRLPFL